MHVYTYSHTHTHPSQVPVNAPSEVEEIFDAISYAKGSCVIRMLHDWIGVEDFRTGLGNYLKKFAYQNARTEDLWASLEDVSKKPVATVMSTWTKQMGYPVLSVDGKQVCTHTHTHTENSFKIHVCSILSMENTFNYHTRT